MVEKILISHLDKFYMLYISYTVITAVCRIISVNSPAVVRSEVML